MRDRRPLLARRREEEDGVESAVAMPPEDLVTRNRRYKQCERQHEKREIRRGILSYAVLLLLFLGIPLFVVVYNTPFFVIENIKCRLDDKVRSDPVVKAMDSSYTAYFSDPPLYLTEEYNRSVYWGTYEPSRIFALKSRAERPVTVGLAWYDTARAHPLRHHMSYMHNKVNAARSASKAGQDPELMTVYWVTHDGLHYGKQTVIDVGNKVSFDIEFLKSPSGDSWYVRIHGNVETTAPLEVVLYVANEDTDAPLEVEAPDGHNDGDWSPLITGQQVGATGVSEAFFFRVYDDHNPLFDTEPWRIFGLHVPYLDAAFSLTISDAVGGMPAERAKTSGRGITAGHSVGDLQQQQLDLRDLPRSAFTYIDSADQATFTAPENPAKAKHNLLVLKKIYSTSFRLELSLRPSTTAESASGRQDDGARGYAVPRYEALTTCQLTNIFRRREKAIFTHTRKIAKRWLVHSTFNVSKSLYELISTRTASELFGSMYYGAGRYLQADSAVDEAWERDATAVTLFSDDQTKPATHVARAWAVVGSRTDEPFGQQHLTGLQLFYLVRWNKEIAKDVAATWLLAAQDPVTGFVPARALFTGATRSLAPRALRYEHTTFGTPPTLLLGLEELLREIERRPKRAARAGNKRKRRNRSEYLQEEQDADRAYLELLLPALKRWRSWWHRTQCGLVPNCEESRRPLEEWPSKPTGLPTDLLAYRWRSRDGDRLPASGMEDYPRAVCPREHRYEAHVDLFSWIALLSTLITRIEERHLGVPASVTVDWEAHLEALHWDATRSVYADRAGCAAGAFSPYIGYANLYPVMLGIVRENTSKVAATVHLAKELWSAHGLMAVSLASVRQARNDGLSHSHLWMGYIWPSANLMFAYALKARYVDLLGGAAGGGREVNTMYEQLAVTISETLRADSRWWEYFNPVNGDGEGSKTYIGTRSLLLGVLGDFA